LVVRAGGTGEAIVAALREHQWTEALFTQRDVYERDVQLWLFGHALMEKLVAPRKAITAHTRVVLADDTYFALDQPARRDWLDQHLAAALASEELNTACFTPLPVLGVPGWCEDQDAAFYADTSVFRPKTRKA
ncbi:MAG: DUF3025 domain-containing protein, partial [Massilia sp.]